MLTSERRPRALRAEDGFPLFLYIASYRATARGIVLGLECIMK